MEVQIFGIKGSSDTRKALRFFAERRIRTHFVDLKERAASRRELERFARVGGVEHLVDRTSRRFRDLGLGASYLSESAWLARLLDEPLLLRMPLVRWKDRVTVGADEPSWKGWIEEDRRG